MTFKSKVKTSLLIFTAALLLSSCSPKDQTKNSISNNSESIQIDYTNGQYTPSEVTIKVGQTVTFNNKGDDLIWPASNIHPTHEIYPDFDPQKPLNPNNSWSFTFTKPGIWKFHDHLMPQLIGEITVEE